jgi:hypothetical protein
VGGKLFVVKKYILAMGHLDGPDRHGQTDRHGWTESWTCGSRLTDRETGKHTEIKDDGWYRQMDNNTNEWTDRHNKNGWTD